jgi:hypothetical protein
MKMGTSKKHKSLVLAAAVAMLVFASGCGELQKALDDLTTQNVDFYQGFYDGNPERVARAIPIADSVALTTAGPVEISVQDAYEIEEQVAASYAGVEEVRYGLSGSVENVTGTSGRYYVFFAPNSTPAENEALLIGSMTVDAYATREFIDSEGFDQPVEEIEANIVDYFAANQGEREYHVFMYAQGADGIKAHRLYLNATPAFAKTRVIPASLVSAYSQGQEGEVTSVAVTGDFANLGTAPARFVWVVGHSDDDLTVDGNVILDAWVQPGDSIPTSEALVEGGLKTLKGYVKDLSKGTNITGSLFVVSDETVNVDILKFRVEFEAEVSVM